MIKRFQDMKKKGIRIQTMGVLLFALFLVACGLILASGLGLRKESFQLIESDKAYYINETDGQELEKGSDNLTYQVRQFAQTGDLKYLEAYFDEVESGRRERAIENLQATDEEEKYLRLALQKSEELMQLEYHIMKLVVLSYEIESDRIPDVVIGYPLSQEEIGLDKAEMKNRAKELAYGMQYHQLKDDVDENVSRFIEAVLERQSRIMEEKEENVQRYVTAQQSVVGVAVLLLCLAALLFYRQISDVLKQQVQAIEQHQRLPEKGVYELRYLANAYNGRKGRGGEKDDVQNRHTEYGSLAGAANKGIFEHIVGEMLSGGKKGCLLLIAIDKFKDIDETYGRDVKDEVLRNVTAALNQNLRRCDYVGRMGGDEFAVWVSELTKDNGLYVRKRIAIVNDKMLHPRGGLPPASLSVGAAFNEPSDNFRELYEKAKAALSQVKEGGRCGCAVYEQNNNGIEERA